MWLDTLSSWDQQLTLMCNGSHSLMADGFMMAVSETWTWIPLAGVLLYILLRNNDILRFGLILLLLGLCILFADQVASGVFKPMVQRFRPSNDPNLMYVVDVVNEYRGGRYGFFSSHAANTFSIAVFLALLTRYRPFSIAVFSWAILNAWSRVYLGVHYLGDVIVGAVWGSFVGALLFCLFRKKIVMAHDESPSSRSAMVGHYTATRYLTADMQLMTNAVLLTYIFIFIYATLFV